MGASARLVVAAHHPLHTPPPRPQGGFTYVTVIMGVLMTVTGFLILALRAWVRHDGGLPEGGLASRGPSMVSSKVPALPTPPDDGFAVGRGKAKSDV